jgi:hypothetical protein
VAYERIFGKLNGLGQINMLVQEEFLVGKNLRHRQGQQEQRAQDRGYLGV